MASYISGKERRALAKKKKAEDRKQAQAMCDKLNEEISFEREVQREVASLTEKPTFNQLEKKSQNFRKHFYQVQNEKDLVVQPGKTRDVKNCPILLKKPGLPEGARKNRIESFEPLFVEQDLVLY